MENNLYYTPTIEEFHVGFEYEITKYPNIPLVCTNTTITLLIEHDEYIDELRVKYLDQSDIESLGWKSAGGYLNIKNFELSTGNAEKNTKENQWKLQLKEDNKIIIEQYRWMRFFGTIKNKSELIKLMQQLNIK